MDRYFPREPGALQSLIESSASRGCRSRSQLAGLVQSVAECFQVRAESRGIEGVEGSDVLKQLVELRLDLELEAAILVQRGREAIKGEDEAFGSLAEDGRRGCIAAEVGFFRGQHRQQSAHGTF